MAIQRPRVKLLYNNTCKVGLKYYWQESAFKERGAILAFTMIENK
ncbi:MAG TPA: hypothetical protein VFU31_09020 [Candidatus Binatia bacterium]|nr:hypothetical protein [Candidatus Binatia bacterium]